MKLSAEEKFWNDPKNIIWFSKEPIPKYWQDFFEKVDRSRIVKVLDLGCGAGRNSELLVRLGFDLYACDLHEAMVKETIKRLENKFPKRNWKEKVIKASMLNLPYKDSFFDAIISSGVFHNVKNVSELEIALRESARVLRKGGCICFNLFSSKYVAPELKMKDQSGKVFLTAENLYMTLVSSEEFLGIAKKYGLVLNGKIIEYEREVSTGKRSVMRGILKKV